MGPPNPEEGEPTRIASIPDGSDLPLSSGRGKEPEEICVGMGGKEEMPPDRRNAAEKGVRL